MIYRPRVKYNDSGVISYIVLINGSVKYIL